MRVLEHFHQRLIDSLVRLIRNTLENLRRNLTLASNLVLGKFGS